MKRPVLLNTPARVLIAVGAVILVGEFLIMLLIESIHDTLLKDVFLERMAFEFIDPILLIILVSPALLLLIFKPMRAQQVELERQLDELRRFQSFSIGRELRMKELVEEIDVLRNPLSTEPAGDIPVTSGSLEAPRHAAGHVTAQPIEQSQRSALLFMLEDLEAGRKKIEQSHQEWIAALDVVDDPIFLHDKEFRILRCNKAYQRCAGIPFKQIIGQPYYEIFPKNHEPLPHCQRAMEKAAAAEEEVAVGGAIYRSRAFSIHDEQGVYLYSVHTLEDITEKQRAEAERQRLSEAIRQAAEAIAVVNADACITYINPAFTRLFGYAPEEIIGKSMGILSAPAAETVQPDEAFRIVREHGSFQGEVLLQTRDGTILTVYINVAALHGTKGEFGGFVTAITDLRPIKASQQRIIESEAKYRLLIESLQEGIWMIDKDACTSFVNLRMAQMLGYSIEEMQGRHLFSFMDERGKEIATQNLERRKQEIREQHDFELLRKDGSRIYTSMATSPILDEAGNYAGALAGVTDITERKQAEAAIQHANRALATLSAVNHTLVHATNKDELLQAVCKAIVEQRGYRLAWVGYVQHDANKSIKIMTRAGQDECYVDAMQLTWAESERGMGSSGRAIRSSATQLCQDMANDPLFLPWRDAALKCGYASCITLPLLDGGNTVFGILSVYAAEVNAFTHNEIDLLEEMAGDLAFGVRTLHTRHERDLALEKNQQQLVQLQDSLEDTVRAIATIGEMRDPYTAGHQVRVADLAAAIARQMGLPDEQVHGIHLAGVVHDLGKIQIPAEILSKPGKISGIEFSLIKIHSQAGYDILKGISFPWPIAQIVLQHHERLDGSGYPQGLKGDDILLEARILTVADVVEAMYSHRPYRPGLGLDAALAEITRQRGIYFDPAVVDACLVLFREQHYSFNS